MLWYLLSRVMSLSSRRAVERGLVGVRGAEEHDRESKEWTAQKWPRPVLYLQRSSKFDSQPNKLHISQTSSSMFFATELRVMHIYPYRKKVVVSHPESGRKPLRCSQIVPSYSPTNLTACL